MARVEGMFDFYFLERTLISKLTIKYLALYSEISNKLPHEVGMQRIFLPLKNAFESSKKFSIKLLISEFV